MIIALTAYINLSSKEITIEEGPHEVMEKFLGSRGYAAKILYDNVGPDIDPLDPDNYLIFSTGPLTGMPWPTSARYTVTAKSPRTGVYGYENSSGFFGPELRRAGFDALVFFGSAKSPVFLRIEDQQLQLLDAGEYWGKNTEETERLLREKYEKRRVASIGPAGEHLVRVASIINDYGAFRNQ